MTRIALTFAVLALFANDLLAQIRFMGRQDGDAIFVSLPMEKLSQTPEWDSSHKDELEPPISIGKAIRLAKLAVSEKYPQHKNKLWSVSVEFCPEPMAINTGDCPIDDSGNRYFRNNGTLEMTINKWVYWIRFRWSPLFGNAITNHLSPSIPVAVLMDGTVLVAQKERMNVSDQELKASYRKWESLP